MANSTTSIAVSAACEYELRCGKFNNRFNAGYAAGFAACDFTSLNAPQTYERWQPMPFDSIGQRISTGIQASSSQAQVAWSIGAIAGWQDAWEQAYL